MQFRFVICVIWMMRIVKCASGCRRTWDSCKRRKTLRCGWRTSTTWTRWLWRVSLLQFSVVWSSCLTTRHRGQNQRRSLKQFSNFRWLGSLEFQTLIEWPLLSHYRFCSDNNATYGFIYICCDWLINWFVNCVTETVVFVILSPNPYQQSHSSEDIKNNFFYNRYKSYNS